MGRRKNLARLTGLSISVAATVMGAPSATAVAPPPQPTNCVPATDVNWQEAGQNEGQNGGLFKCDQGFYKFSIEIDGYIKLF